MDTVAFVSIETGKDLILSFALMERDDPTQIRSLILLRTPMYESSLEEWERGVKVTLEFESDDEDDLLEAVQWDEASAIVRIKTQRRRYDLDLRKVDKKHIASMRKILKKMNFDRRIELTGV